MRSRPARFLLLCITLASGCDSLWGGDFGNDPDAASARLQAIVVREGLTQLGFSEPGEEGTRFVDRVRSSAPECDAALVARICAETAAIRHDTGASVEVWCVGTPTTWICIDGARSARR